MRGWSCAVLCVALGCVAEVAQEGDETKSAEGICESIGLVCATDVDITISGPFGPVYEGRLRCGLRAPAMFGDQRYCEANPCTCQYDGVTYNGSVSTDPLGAAALENIHGDVAPLPDTESSCTRFGLYCRTPMFSCGLGDSMPVCVGTPCYCNSSNGPIEGHISDR